MPVARFGPQTFGGPAEELASGGNGCSPELPDDDAPVGLESLASLKPVGQIRESFILAINPQGLWIIDQHVAHERISSKKSRSSGWPSRRRRQQLLMPLIVELTPGQMAVFAESPTN